jgi:hypothetical protein
MDVGTHRYGWINVKNVFNKLFNNNEGIELRSYGDVGIRQYLNNPWVGIFHLTPLTTKKYFKESNLYNFKNNPIFLHNLTLCKGVFTLANYISNRWKGIFNKLGLNIPVDTVYHPVEFDGGEFNPDLIDTINTVVFIGSQIRRPSTIFRLTLPTFRKIWLSGGSMETAHKKLANECEEFSITLTEDQKKSVEILLLNNE